MLIAGKNRIAKRIRRLCARCPEPEIIAAGYNIIAKLKWFQERSEPYGCFIGTVDDTVCDGQIADGVKQQERIFAFLENAVIHMYTRAMCPDRTLYGRRIFFSDKKTLGDS